MNGKLHEVAEVARTLELSKSYVYELIRRGQLPAVRFGTAVRIRPEDLERFIQVSLTSQPQSPSVQMYEADRS